MDNAAKLNKTLFLLGRFLKRVEIKENRIIEKFLFSKWLYNK